MQVATVLFLGSQCRFVKVATVGVASVEGSKSLHAGPTRVNFQGTNRSQMTTGTIRTLLIVIVKEARNRGYIEENQHDFGLM